MESKETHGSYLSSMSGDFFGMLGLSSLPAAEAKKASPPLMLSLDDCASATAGVESLSLDSTAFTAQASLLPAPLLPTPAPIGCGPGMQTRTMIVSGGLGRRDLDVMLSQSASVAKKAIARHNKLGFAFLGNFSRGAMQKVMELKNSGIMIGDQGRVPEQEVILIAGNKDLAWLRLINGDAHSREIVRSSDPDAAVVLRHPTPLSWSPALIASWKEHNKGVDSMSSLPANHSENVIAVMMFVKLVSMTRLTMDEPDLVEEFMQMMEKEPKNGDAVSKMELRSFMESFDGLIESGMEKLVAGEELTPEGLGILPAARQIVDRILEYAQKAVASYLRSSFLVHGVKSRNAATRLWLSSTQLSTQEAAGKLPIGVDERNMEVLFRDHSGTMSEWEERLNSQFSTFLRQLLRGEVSTELYNAYVAVASSTKQYPLPVSGLKEDSPETVQAVTSHGTNPFATLQRRNLFKISKSGREGGLVGVLEQWVNVGARSPSWGVCTWCGGLESDLALPSPFLNLSVPPSVHIDMISVIIASMLSVDVGGGVLLKEHGHDNINGLLGPIVTPRGTRKSQPMRLVHFTHQAVKTQFVALLPEAFIHTSLDYYDLNYRRKMSRGSPFLVAEGFTILYDKDVVQLQFPGVLDAELEDVIAETGKRLWKFGPDSNIPDATACEAMRASVELGREVAAPSCTVFHTRQTSNDPFAGLQIGLTRVPGRPRITLDTDMTEFHALFRVRVTE